MELWWGHAGSRDSLYSVSFIPPLQLQCSVWPFHPWASGQHMDAMLLYVCPPLLCSCRFWGLVLEQCIIHTVHRPLLKVLLRLHACEKNLCSCRATIMHTSCKLLYFSVRLYISPSTSGKLGCNACWELYCLEHGIQENMKPNWLANLTVCSSYIAFLKLWHFCNVLQVARIFLHVRLECRLAVPVGSSTAWSMVYSQTGRCPLTKPSAEETTPSTPSAREALDSTFPEPCSLTWNLLT